MNDTDSAEDGYVSVSRYYRPEEGGVVEEGDIPFYLRHKILAMAVIQ